MAEEDVDWTQMFDRVKQSIFFVQFIPKEANHEELKIVAKRVKTIEEEKRNTKAIQAHTSTGFVYFSEPTRLLITTSAHGLSHLFSASEPLTLETLGMMEINVLCDHHEEVIQEARMFSAERKYTSARAVGVDSMKDIVILSVKPNELKNHMDNLCAQGHPPLEISPNMPINDSQCMMISWPPHMHRMLSMGKTISSRMIGVPNPFGYNMTVLEVDMRTEDRSSGAPLFNANGVVIGMLHGRLSRSRSIFVAGSHLHQLVQGEAASGG